LTYSKRDNPSLTPQRQVNGIDTQSQQNMQLNFCSYCEQKH
jgi:hypothetical protein